MQTKPGTTGLGLQPERDKPVLVGDAPLVDGMPVGDTLVLVDGRPGVVAQRTGVAVSLHCR